MTLLTTVYRVENALGHGPYRALDLEHPDENICVEDPLLEMKDDHSFRSLRFHPTPSMDFDLKTFKKLWFNGQRDYYRFGFESLDDLYNWFDGYTDLLKDFGFKIKAYNTHKVYKSYSRKQVLCVLPKKIREKRGELIEWRK